MEIKFQNGANLKRGLICAYFSHFLVPQPGKRHISFFSIYLTYIHTRILLTVLNLIFCLLNFGKKIKFIMYCFSLERLLLLILVRAILGQSINNKMLSKFKLKCLLLIFIYTNGKCILICKHRTLN